MDYVIGGYVVSAVVLGLYSWRTLARGRALSRQLKGKQ